MKRLSRISSFNNQDDRNANAIIVNVGVFRSGFVGVDIAAMLAHGHGALLLVHI